MWIQPISSVRPRKALPEIRIPFSISDHDSDVLLKIGELAKLVGEPNSTIRHWTKTGLLEVAETTRSGYQMYSHDMIQRIALIRELKARRLTLGEIIRQLDDGQ